MVYYSIINSVQTTLPLMDWVHIDLLENWQICDNGVFAGLVKNMANLYML